MYDYRKLSPEERRQLVAERLRRGYPPHRPPHLDVGQAAYLLTAACHEHRHHINSAERRQQLLDLLLEQFILRGMAIYAWVVLTNHYHMLVYVTEPALLGGLFRQVHGRTAYDWNRFDNTQGRQVWYRYSDRLIRSEAHFNTTLNYIHYNPVKHGLAATPYDWRWSSVGWYLDMHGRAWLRDLWQRFPLHDYGHRWDD